MGIRDFWATVHYGGVAAVDVTDKGFGVALQWTPCVSFNTVSAPVALELWAALGRRQEEKAASGTRERPSGAAMVRKTHTVGKDSSSRQPE
ncbi:hypothetical protein R6Q59_009574 [Mikania micrantha]